MSNKAARLKQRYHRESQKTQPNLNQITQEVKEDESHMILWNDDDDYRDWSWARRNQLLTFLQKLAIRAAQRIHDWF